MRIFSVFLAWAWACLAQAALPIEHWTTSTGARVYFVESHELPMLDVSVEFAAGSSRDTPKKSGLAGMTLRLMRLGVQGMDENAISEQLADVGAALGMSFDVDRAGYSLRTLSKKEFREAALAIMTKVLSQPSFPEAVLTREVQHAVSEMKESEIKPETAAGRAFSKMVFGDHPYQLRSSGETDTLPALARADLMEFYGKHFHASAAVVALMGDVTRAQAALIAEQLTSGLGRGTKPAPIPPVNMILKGEERFISHPSAQAHILIGGPGVKRADPDYFPLLVGNYILGGGGFNSRLTLEVREKRGLTYSVYSALSPYREAGAFQIGLQTRRDQAKQALQVVRDTLKTFLTQGPTAAELEGAKQNLIGGFPLRIDTSRKILEYLAVIGFYDLPLDYLEQFPERISQVTLQQVKEAFARRVDPSRLATVVVGGENN
ncbi:MAG: M16 family metallopeptidase [Burkholderiales bacterium]